MTAMYVRCADLPSERVGTDVVVVDVERDLFFSSNAVGSLIWERLSKPSSIEEIANAVSRSFEDVDADTAKIDTKEFVIRLVENGLVQKHSA